MHDWNIEWHFQGFSDVAYSGESVWGNFEIAVLVYIRLQNTRLQVLIHHLTEMWM